MTVELIQFTGIFNSVRCCAFLCLTTNVTTQQFHTAPRSSHASRCEVICFLYYSLCFRGSCFNSCRQDLCFSLSFFWNASFFLFVMPLIPFLFIQTLLLGNIFTVFRRTALCRKKEKNKKKNQRIYALT